MPAGKTCRAKLECTNPIPSLAPTTRASPAIRAPTIITMSQWLDATFRRAAAARGRRVQPDLTRRPRRYIENCTCAPSATRPAQTRRCVVLAQAVIRSALIPLGSAEFCGAIWAAIARGDVDASGVPGPMGGDNNGINCAQLPNVAGATCTGGACTNLSCDPGFGDCDGDPANGLRGDLTTDALHCGQRNAACTATWSGVATATCAGGQCNVTAIQVGLTAKMRSRAASTCAAGCTVDVFVGGTGRDGCETVRQRQARTAARAATCAKRKQRDEANARRALRYVSAP